MPLNFVAFPAGRKVTAMRIQENVLKKLSLVGASSRPKIQLTEILNSKLLRVELARLILSVLSPRVIPDVVTKRTP